MGQMLASDRAGGMLRLIEIPLGRADPQQGATVNHHEEEKKRRVATLWAAALDCIKHHCRKPQPQMIGTGGMPVCQPLTITHKSMDNKTD
eukprot:scaffold57103_cov35-Prasinocladus_malaysianus.AAC.3